MEIAKDDFDAVLDAALKWAKEQDPDPQERICDAVGRIREAQSFKHDNISAVHRDVYQIADYIRGLRTRDIPDMMVMALAVDYQRFYLGITPVR